MKLNWGTNIAFVYIGFVIAIVAIAVWLSSKDTPMVTDNYYAKELVYQEEIDKINRTNELPQQLEINLDDSQIVLHYPKMFSYKEIQGEIHFYRPDNDLKDFFSDVSVDSSHTQTVSLANKERGLWKIKVNWSVDGISYYNEKFLMVN